MADILKDKNREIYKDLQNTEPKYNEELKQSGSSAFNPFQHKTRELFSTYFVSRHNPDGSMNTGQWDALSTQEKRQFDNYVMRRSYESSMRDSGIDDEQIALMRQWDDDLKEAALSGTTERLLASGVLTSEEYMEKAQAQYHWDEQMFDRYVATARTVAQEIYQPDGDGLFNVTEQALTTFKDSSHEELQELYKWMTPDQKRQLQFDGIDNEIAFSNFFKAKSMEHEQLGQLSGWDKVGNFFKAIPSAFVGAIVETFTLPVSIAGIVAGAVTGDWNNAVTKWSFKATEDAKSFFVDNIDEATGVNTQDSSYKWGSVAGEGIELVAETALSFGMSSLIKTGVAKIGVKQAAKAATKAATKGSAKLAKKASAKMSKNMSRLITQNAKKAARKAGKRKLTAKELRDSSDKVVRDFATKRLGKKTLTDAEVSAVRKTFLKEVNDAETTAVIRLAREGMIEASEKELSVMTGKFTKAALTQVAKEGVKKAAKEGVIEGAKKAVKKTATTTAKKVTKAEKKAIKEAVSGWMGTAKKVSKITSMDDTEFALKAISKMASKQGPVKRSLRFAFGETDPLTKLFSLKSFAGVVRQGQEKGYTPYEAILRGTFAYATTNMIWGRMHFGGSKAQEKLLGRIFGENAAKVGASGLKGVGMKSLGIFNSNLEMVVKMIGSETIEEFIIDGFRKAEDGKTEWGLTALKHNVNWSNIREKFITALTMNISGSVVGSTAGRLARNNPLTTRYQKKKATSFIDGKMSSQEGIGLELWNEYKDRAKKDMLDSQEKSKNSKELREEDIVDNAIALASAESSEVAKLATDFYIQHTATDYGYNLAKKEKHYEDLVNLEVKRVNDAALGIDKREIILGGKEKSTHERETESKYKLYMQRSVTNNANVEGKPEKIKIGDIEIENTEPRVMVAGYAFFKNMKIKDYNNKIEVDKAIKDSQDQARKLRDKLTAEGDKEGKKIWEKIAELPDNLLHNIMTRLNKDSESNPENYLKVRDSVLEVIDKYKKGEISAEDFKTQISLVLERYSDQTQEFNEYANRENSKGNSDANDLKDLIDPEIIRMKEELVNEMNTGKDGAIKSSVKKIYDRHLLKDNIVRSVNKMFTYLKNLNELGSGGNNKLSTENYFKSVASLYEYINSIKDVKNALNSDVNSKYKAIARVSKMMSNRGVYPSDIAINFKNKLDTLETLSERIKKAKQDKETNRLTQEELDEYSRLVGWVENMEKSISSNGKDSAEFIAEVYNQIDNYSGSVGTAGRLKDFIENNLKDLKVQRSEVFNKETTLKKNILADKGSIESKTIASEEAKAQFFGEKQIPKNEESTNTEQIPIDPKTGDVDQKSLNDLNENRKESTVDEIVSKEDASFTYLKNSLENNTWSENSRTEIDKQIKQNVENMLIARNSSKKVKTEKPTDILLKDSGLFIPKEEIVDQTSVEDVSVETKPTEKVTTEKETTEKEKDEIDYESLQEDFESLFEEPLEENIDKC